MEISITINDSEVKAALAELQAKTANLLPAMQAIGKYYEARVAENFRRQAAPDGTKWRKLSQTTLALGLLARKGFKKSGDVSKRGRRYLAGKRILWEHGDLAGSIHYQADASSVVIGTGDHIPYAAIHQFGGQAGRNHKVTIPARPYLALNRGGEMALADRDRDRVVEILRGYLMRESI